MHIIDHIQRELSDENRYWIEWPTTVITLDEKVFDNGSVGDPSSGPPVRDDFNTVIDQSLEIPSEELKAS